MAEGWLPPQAPGGQAPPRTWDRPEAAHPVVPPPADPVPGRTFVQPAAADDANGAAVAALVCGLLGLVFLVGSIGLLSLLSLPLSICAWVFGAKGRARADRGEAGQRGLAHAGWIMGIVGTVLGVVAFIGWTLLIALTDDLFEDVQRELEQDGYTVAALAGLAIVARVAAGL